MRFHILGLPHTVTSKEFNACAYTQKVFKFGKMMTERGHEVIHYGHEDSDLPCTEHVTVLTNKDFEIAYGGYDWRKNFFKYDMNDHAYQTFFTNAIREVGKRKQKNDFILPFWGAGTRPVCDAHPDLITVEPGIGYAGGHWARWKIFESYAIYHAYCGLEAVGTCKQDWYDAVIPNYFDPDDFEFKEQKQDYFLFLGRVYSGKGIDIAIQVTEKIGAKLVIAGQNPENRTFPPHVEFVGYADVEKRKQLMSNAKAAFVASQYVEPFGGVQIELLFSGTPTITTDWGSFAENNIHGVTGYRCRTFEQFEWAARNIGNIDPKDCRQFAENFSLARVAPMYEEYFQGVLDVYAGKGWYQEHPDRTQLDWLRRTIPAKASIPPTAITTPIAPTINLKKKE
jgi:glycosyltransferase involved in cell wall biosynthesis